MSMDSKRFENLSVLDRFRSYTQSAFTKSLLYMAILKISNDTFKGLSLLWVNSDTDTRCTGSAQYIVPAIFQSMERLVSMLLEYKRGQVSSSIMIYHNFRKAK